MCDAKQQFQTIFGKAPILLAPMSGISDLPFRRVCLSWGCDAVVSEMVAAKAYLTGEAEARLRSDGRNVPLHIVQIAGNEVASMAQTAKMIEQTGAHLIDINMGCPAKRVTGGFSGAHLMRDVDHAARLIEAVRRSVTLPVSIKMRLGWDEHHENAHEIAMMAQNLGCSFVTVHGRTRQQFYKGKANWHKIGLLARCTDLPVIANGDVASPDDVQRIRQVSLADGVMIGRGAIGQPWLFQKCKQPGMPVHNPSLALGKVATVLAHMEGSLSHYGTRKGLLMFRKHLSAYLIHLSEELRPQLTQRLRQKLLQSTCPRTIREHLRAWQQC